MISPFDSALFVLHNAALQLDWKSNMELSTDSEVFHIIYLLAKYFIRMVEFH